MNEPGKYFVIVYYWTFDTDCVKPPVSYLNYVNLGISQNYTVMEMCGQLLPCMMPVIRKQGDADANECSFEQIFHAVFIVWSGAVWETIAAEKWHTSALNLVFCLFVCLLLFEVPVLFSIQLTPQNKDFHSVRSATWGNVSAYLSILLYITVVK